MNQSFQKKQIFTVPNSLSFFRIILIPLILYLYIAKNKLILTIAVIAISGLTDIIDGRIARKYNMISDFGKILDPIADKLTEGALMICLLGRYRLMWILLVLFVLWETCMVILGSISVKWTGNVSSSLWFGKAASIVLYFIMHTQLQKRSSNCFQ
jgi:cardiolipin synthase